MASIIIFETSQLSVVSVSEETISEPGILTMVTVKRVVMRIKHLKKMLTIQNLEGTPYTLVMQAR